jgi:hypothetical protein
MAIVRRNLTVHFQRSVKLTSTDVVTQSVEVSVIPLQDASNAAAIATFVGGVQSLTIPLANEDNIAVFSLVPSNAPGLTNEINYRIMWRIGGVTGRTQTYDFAMPDADIGFEEIQSIGNIISGQAYLQQTDLGVAGRVARLNDLGQVVDAFGLPVASGTDLTTVQARLTTEITARLAEDQERQEFVQGQIQSQIGSVLNTTATNLNSSVAALNSAISSEVAARTGGDNALTASLSSLEGTVTSNAQSASASIATINTALNTKADLDSGGKIPIGQIPAAAITSWISLASAADRLALTHPSQIQVGDVVLTPSGVYLLTGTTPSNTSSWYLLNQVLSVNGQTGSIVLNPNDVGVTTGSSGSRVIASGITIPQAQVTGLTTLLSTLATQTTTTGLQTQIDTIKNDAGYVKLNGSGVINTSLLGTDVALINGLNQVVKKDGTVIGSGSGGSVFSVNNQTGVVTITTTSLGAVSTGALTTALATKADLVSGKIPVAQIPTGIPQASITSLEAALATKATLVSGKLPVDSVQGLTAILTNNGLTSTSNLAGRVYTLEQSGGGSGGSGTASTKSVFWGGAGVSDTTDVTNLTSVNLFSPFGIYSTGPNAGQPYYRGAGVPASDVAFPLVTAGGHLQLNKWNESNAPDPVYALAGDLTALSSTVTALNTAVSGKASTSSVTALSGTVTGLTTSKADLVSGKVPVAQIPTGIAQSNITGLEAALSALTITAGTTAQYFRGDKTFQALNQDVVPSGTTNKVFTATEQTKLAGIAAGATVNSTDAVLLARANHTGTQTVATLSDFATAVDARINNVTVFTGKTISGANNTLSNIPQAAVTGLTAALDGKASLTGGVLSPSQVPPAALGRPKVFTTTGALAAMNALTFSQVSLGDQCIITANTGASTTDIGTYTVVGTNGTTGAPVWQKHPGSSAAGATSIIGSGATRIADANGAITLSPSDIGAAPAGSYVTTSSLATSLTNYVTTAGLATTLSANALNTTQFNSVRDFVRTSAPIRGRVDYACTLRLAAVSGNPQIGVDALGNAQIAQNASRILLTNQANKRDNGIWIVNTVGPWSRPVDDYNTGQTILPNTIVLVSCRTSSFPAGSTNFTLWQCTNTTSVLIGDGETSWGDANGATPSPYGYMSQPIKLTAATGPVGNGIVVGGTYPNVTLSQTVGAGITATSAGPAIDTSVVARKYSTILTVTTGGGNYTVTHGLSIPSGQAPHVSVMESGGSGWAVLVGWKKNSTNPTTQIDLEFGSSVAGNYIVTVIG